MHGTGGYRAQCGIAEGALTFIGMYGTRRGHPEKEMISFYKAFARSFVEAAVSCAVF